MAPTIIREMKKQYIPWPWNHLAIPTVRAKAPAAAVRGHGLYSTK